MIERYVFIKLTGEYATPEGRAAVAERSRGLSELAGVRSLRLGLPADERAAAAWDLSMVLCFDDLEAVERYRGHREHRAYVDEFLAPRTAAIKVWNFTV
jgi:hypothetical protein